RVEDARAIEMNRHAKLVRKTPHVSHMSQRQYSATRRVMRAFQTNECCAQQMRPQAGRPQLLAEKIDIHRAALAPQSARVKAGESSDTTQLASKHMRGCLCEYFPAACSIRQHTDEVAHGSRGHK